MTVRLALLLGLLSFITITSEEVITMDIPTINTDCPPNTVPVVDIDWDTFVCTSDVLSDPFCSDSMESFGVADYGNWCGYSNTHEDRTYPCKDGVDCVCRRHDLCLRDNRYHRCGCDYHFIKDLLTASCSNPHCEAYRVAAIGVFQMKPCECRKRVCVAGKCWVVKFPGVGGKPNC